MPQPKAESGENAAEQKESAEKRFMAIALGGRGFRIQRESGERVRFRRGGRLAMAENIDEQGESSGVVVRGGSEGVRGLADRIGARRRRSRDGANVQQAKIDLWARRLR